MAMKKEKFITVMAVFDHETQLLLEELQNNFEHRYGIDTKTKGIPYHITLGSYAVEQTEEIIARIKDVAGRTEPFAVHFKGLNHFGNVVRYMEPECSEKLLELHQWFDSDYANGFDEWKPHATLYRHAEPTEIEMDAELARKVAELDRARIVGIELGEFFPPKYLTSASFPAAAG